VSSGGAEVSAEVRAADLEPKLENSVTTKNANAIDDLRILLFTIKSSFLATLRFDAFQCYFVNRRRGCPMLWQSGMVGLRAQI
jgi:hypothetical protein